MKKHLLVLLASRFDGLHANERRLPPTRASHASQLCMLVRVGKQRYSYRPGLQIWRPANQGQDLLRHIGITGRPIGGMRVDLSIDKP